MFVGTNFENQLSLKQMYINIFKNKINFLHLCFLQLKIVILILDICFLRMGLRRPILVGQ